MEFHDKFADKFDDLSKKKNQQRKRPTITQLLRTFKRKWFWLYDTITLTMLQLKVFHDMVSQNS